MAIHYKPTSDEVREARLFAKLTQQQSADMCLVTANTWARYEQGLTQMPAPIWRLFEYALTLQEIQGKQATGNRQSRAEADRRQSEQDNQALKNIMGDWVDEPTENDAEEQEAIRVEREITNRLREHKERMIQTIEKASPRLGAMARSEFPDYEGIVYAKVQHHIDKLTPMYNQHKGE